jgi:hypothetical protein
VSLLVLQSLNPNVNVVFLLFVLHFILMIGNVELNPGPETDLPSSSPNLVNSANDNSISLCNINIHVLSIRNKTNFVQHFADEFDILVITESHLDNSIQNDDIELYHIFRLKYRCFVYALSMIVPSLYRLTYIAPLDLYRIPYIVWLSSSKAAVSALLNNKEFFKLFNSILILKYDENFEIL